MRPSIHSFTSGFPMTKNTCPLDHEEESESLEASTEPSTEPCQATRRVKDAMLIKLRDLNESGKSLFKFSRDFEDAIRDMQRFFPHDRNYKSDMWVRQLFLSKLQQNHRELAVASNGSTVGGPHGTWQIVYRDLHNQLCNHGLVIEAVIQDLSCEFQLSQRLGSPTEPGLVLQNVISSCQKIGKALVYDVKYHRRPNGSSFLRVPQGPCLHGSELLERVMCTAKCEMPNCSRICCDHPDFCASNEPNGVQSQLGWNPSCPDPAERVGRQCHYPLPHRHLCYNHRDRGQDSWRDECNRLRSNACLLVRVAMKTRHSHPSDVDTLNCALCYFPVHWLRFHRCPFQCFDEIFCSFCVERHSCPRYAHFDPYPVGLCIECEEPCYSYCPGHGYSRNDCGLPICWKHSWCRSCRLHHCSICCPNSYPNPANPTTHKPVHILTNGRYQLTNGTSPQPQPKRACGPHIVFDNAGSKRTAITMKPFSGEETKAKRRRTIKKGLEMSKEEAEAWMVETIKAGVQVFNDANSAKLPRERCQNYKACEIQRRWRDAYDKIPPNVRSSVLLGLREACAPFMVEAPSSSSSS